MHQVERDVEHLKAQMDGLAQTQVDISNSVKDIATALGELLSLRKAHDYHEVELQHLRETSHKHAGMLQQLAFVTEEIKKMDTRMTATEATGIELRISSAKSGAIIAITTAVLTAGLITGVTELLH